MSHPSAFPALLVVLTLLAGCGVDPLGAAAVVGLATIPVFGRSGADILVSGLSGRDCSVVRLEQGKSYCRRPDPPIEAAPICTRSLGGIDCWTNPDAFPTPLRPLADAPAPTAEQEEYRTRRWPFL
jgi:hypothetical protein